MAITIISYDNSIGHLADNKIIATSSNYNQNGFKYVVDVYVAGLTFWGQSYLRFYVPPKPVTGRLEFNISDVLRDIADVKVFDENNANYCYINNGNAGRIVTTKIGEAYFTSPTTYTITPNLAQVQQRVWMFSYFNKYDRTQLNDMWDITTGVFKDRRIIKKWFNLSFNKAWWLQPISSQEIAANLSKYTIDIDGLIQINDGVSNKLMTIAPITEPLLGVFAIGTVEAGTSNLYQLINSINGSVLTISFTSNTPTYQYSFQIINKCRQDGAIVYWINRYGQLEHYYFDMMKTKINTITTDYIIRKDLDYLNWNGRYYGLEEEIVTLTTTNIIDDNDAEGLRDLLTSKYVWMNTAENPGLIPILITDKAFEVKKYRTDKAFQLTITAKAKQRLSV
ncbi:MAG: hypothetical protein QXF76_02720 [Candidatus Anstonellales archaeon]